MNGMKNSLLLILLLLVGCESSSIEGYDYVATRHLGQDISFEIYSKSHGVYGGSTVKYFLINSSDYHQYVGKCDEKEFFRGTVTSDNIVVQKFTRRNMRNGETKLLKRKVYKRYK